MPPENNANVRSAKLDKLAAIIEDANKLKSEKGYKVDKVRSAEAKAVAEVVGAQESKEAVADIALPSERL